MTNIRTFLAHKIPKKWSTKISNIINNHKNDFDSKIAWIPAENMHITINFNGSIKPDMVNSICESISNLKLKKFILQKADVGFFSSFDQKRIFWLGVNDVSNGLQKNAVKVKETLTALGIKCNDRDFHAHITLARIKKDQNEDWQKLVTELNNLTLPQFEVDELTLFESKLNPTGPTYSEIYKMPYS